MAETLGKYELVKMLGKGAMGTVYEGYDPIIARRLAIKTVRLTGQDDPEAQAELARFRREAQAAGRLTHPNIVGVFDYGEAPDLAYIVMEFVDGTTLKQKLDQGERFELPAILRVMDGLLAGLNYSHERGVVHRDIKPANVMLTQAGEVKIADFGIARIESSSMTQAGTMMGTPNYMSPEQFMGQIVDARTDIYSAGVLLYQLLTGEKPFEGGLAAMMHKVLNADPPPPSVLSVTAPPALDPVVRKAMAKRPEDRFSTAAAFAQALRAAFAGNQEPAPVAQAAAVDADATMVAPRMAPPPPPAARPSTALPAAAVPAANALPAGILAPPAKKSAPTALIGGAVAALLVLAGGAYFLLKPSAPVASAPASSAPAAPAAAAQAPAPPPMSAAQREATLSGTLAALPCTLLSGDDNAAPPVISGLAGAGAPQAALLAAVNSLPEAITPASHVQTIDGPYCDALDAIRPYHPLFAAAGSTLGLALAGGAGVLHDGDYIIVKNHMPGFAGYLETDYFSSDGTVLHLYPASSGAQALQPAGSVKTLGDPAAHGPSWGVAAPFGTDMILSIASASPLFLTPRPQDENASDYLPALRQALQNAVSAGQNVAVAAIPVVTAAK